MPVAYFLKDFMIISYRKNFAQFTTWL